MSNATCPVLSAAGFIGTAAASSAAWSYESTAANPCVKVPGVDAWISILCDPRECEIGDKMDKPKAEVFSADTCAAATKLDTPDVWIHQVSTNTWDCGAINSTVAGCENSGYCSSALDPVEVVPEGYGQSGVRGLNGLAYVGLLSALIMVTVGIM